MCSLIRRRLSSRKLACLIWLLTLAVNALANEGQPFVFLQSEVHGGYKPDIASTEGGLWNQCDVVSLGIDTSPARIREGAVEDYLNEVACRLAPELCNDLTIYLVRKPYFNASMMPNGVMQIWSGLLIRVHNEAELAAVIGHEIGHYARRHSIKQHDNLVVTTGVLTLLGLGLNTASLSGAMDPNIASLTFDVSQLALVASYFKYNRDQERESDQFGIQLLSEAGYQAASAASVWENMIEERALSPSRTPTPPFDYTASHPQPEERQNTLGTLAKRLMTKSSEAADLGSSRYIEAISPILELLLDDEVDNTPPQQAIYVLEGLKEAGFPDGTINFYIGAAYRRRGDEGDAERAKSHFRQALADPVPYKRAHKWLGILLLKDKMKPEARQHFNAFLSAFPDAKDREMVQYYLSLTEN